MSVFLNHYYAHDMSNAIYNENTWAQLQHRSTHHLNSSFCIPDFLLSNVHWTVNTNENIYDGKKGTTYHVYILKENFSWTHFKILNCQNHYIAIIHKNWSKSIFPSLHFIEFYSGVFIATLQDFIEKKQL